MASWFLNSAMIGWGVAALVASPIIIHLINRVRFRRVRFAAMEFLLSSQRRNRRRILIEQLLLLLLRILLVLGLIALIARLVLDPSALSLLRGAEVHHLVLLDDSASMQDRWEETSGFDKAREVIRALVAESVKQGGGQRFTLLLLSRPDQPDEHQRTIDLAFQSEFESRLDSLKCSHRRLDLVKGLEAARLLLEEQATGIKHLHVISDFRLRDWDRERPLVDTISRMDDQDVTINLVRTVPERHGNLVVTGLVGDLQVAAAGVPVRMTATVKNLGEQVVTDVSLAVYLDDQRLPLGVTLERIEAGEEAARSFDVTFDTSNKHTLSVELPADSLAADDQWFLAVDVAPANRVLVIEGDPIDEEGMFPRLALAADSQLSGYQVTVETRDFLYRNSLDSFQSILLLNVPDLSPDAIEALETFVGDGGGLAWYLGDAVNPEAYNNTLYKAGGGGLFPVPLGNAPRELTRDDPDAGPDLTLVDHPVLAALEGPENPEILATRVFKYFPVADGFEIDDRLRNDQVATIARLRNRQPLLLDHRYGRGRIITCMTSCGTSWTNFPRYRSFVPFHFELQKYIARQDRVLGEREVGEPIELELDPAEFGPRVRVTPPGGATPTELRGKTEEVGEANAAGNRLVRHVFDPHHDTDAPGVYRVRMTDSNQVAVERWFAYNVEAEEGELELIDNDAIRRKLGAGLAGAVHIQNAGSLEWLVGREADQEIRDWLLLALVLVLLAEQAMAYRLSFHAELAGAAA